MDGWFLLLTLIYVFVCKVIYIYIGKVKKQALTIIKIVAFFNDFCKKFLSSPSGHFLFSLTPLFSPPPSHLLPYRYSLFKNWNRSLQKLKSLLLESMELALACSLRTRMWIVNVNTVHTKDSKFQSESFYLLFQKNEFLINLRIVFFFFF